MTIKRLEVKRNKNDAELLVYGPIGDDWGGTVARAVKQDLTALGAVDTLTIRINSDGGSLFEGIGIYNAIREANAKSRVTVVDSVAASAASLIALAGDVRRMPLNTWQMVHNPAGFTVGDYREHEQSVMLLKRLGENVAQVYAERTGQSIELVREWMDAETWFSAADAEAAGLATEVSEPIKVAAQLDPRRYPNAPRAVLDAVAPDLVAQRLAEMRRKVDRYMRRG